MTVPTELELCERFLPLLRAFGRRRLRDSADELAQEALVIVLAALREGRVASSDKLGAYVYGVARNLAREGYRKEQRDRRLAGSLAPLGAEASAPPRELDQRLRHCFARLTPRARAVLHRAILEEESAHEIASALGISAANVRVTRHRALAELRKCMQTEER